MIRVATYHRVSTLDQYRAFARRELRSAAGRLGRLVLQVEESISECLRPRSQEESLAEFRARLEAQPFPQYHPVVGQPEHMVRVDTDGTRTMGRVVGRRCEPVGNAGGGRK